jgi:dethiobiotin synthetase
MSTRATRRIVVLGTGTGVGKTWLARELIRALRAGGRRAIGLKPIESGVVDPDATDGALLASATFDDPARARALELSAPYRFPDPISPHLAARRVDRSVSIERALIYVRERESSPEPAEPAFEVSVVETAGGLFSPLAPGATNWDLAQALAPARWLLVAPDALGVLHDLTATLIAARSRGHEPDAIALCRARPADASTGTNAGEIELLRLAPRPVVFPDDGQAGLERLITQLLA